MRLRSLFMVLAAALLVLATGGPASIAQNPVPPGRIPPPQGRSLFNMFWQIPERPAMRPQPLPRQRAVTAPTVIRRSSGPVVVRDDPVVPKVDIAHHIVVLGDSLANLVASGLDEALNDRPDVAVVHKAKPDSGLVRSDFYDWPKAVTELLASDQKITVAVMMLGLNDRQAIREGEIVHEPLSERWLQLYRDRVDAIASAFVAKRVPLIWIGEPPMQNARLSADLAIFNDIYRQRVERAGGQYVDLWGAYVDAENRYTAMGPDVTGQTTRLRLGDGIHFTKAGARKAAHFVDVLLRRMIEQRPSDESVIALPAPPSGTEPSTDPTLQPGGVERMIDNMVRGLPELSGLAPALQSKPLAGPIQPLTGPATTGDKALLASIPDARGRGEVASELDRVFGDGLGSEPKPGRIDDYRWPRN